MIPITRKELYLNKIVGNNEYETPEKPIIEEEFFFAEILGEAVQAPEPLTRYQMYLAKIAGRNIEIPTPITRLEHFLARAAGMEIETPTPITREEMFWADYALIELNGIPPLTFKSDGAELKSYRIYGAAGGVGDYDENSGKYVIPVTVSGKNLLNHIATNRVIDQTLTVVVNNDRSITLNGASSSTQSINIIQDFIPQPGYTYILSGCPSGGSYSSYTMDMLNNNGIIRADSGNGTSFNADDRIGILRIRIRIAANFTCNNLTFYPMIRLANAGNSAYEPYIESATINIFLDEPVYEGKSVSMADTSIQIGTIDGTNILTVGTEVQPSGVEIKGRIQEVTP